jgi:hypothetical protein
MTVRAILLNSLNLPTNLEELTRFVLEVFEKTCACNQPFFNKKNRVKNEIIEIYKSIGFVFDEKTGEARRAV